MRGAFTLVELLVTIAVVAVLAALAAGTVPGLIVRAVGADALGKIRQTGAAVLHYPADHNGVLPPLFPGQVLEYEEGRGGRIVTECAAYLGVEPQSGKYLVTSLMPRAYARLSEPKDKNAMRVFVMNTAMTNNGTVINPFGRVTTPGKPPTGNTPLASLAGSGNPWMMSTADQKQPNVVSAPWRGNTPQDPPLGNKRAIFRFDGAGELVIIEQP
ncbi:MAG: prepilin-type N-terminal cleavage/methylation domain-containing protein [Chthoniobacterales bacterium]